MSHSSRLSSFARRVGRVSIAGVLLATALVPGVAAAQSELPLTVYLPAYVDVGPDAPFEEEIRRLHASGVTRGCTPDGRAFCPARAVTRGEMAAFLVRAMGPDAAGAVDSTGFVDAVASVFEADIVRLAATGVTKGCNPPLNDSFCPDRAVTRAEMAAFIVRAPQIRNDATPGGFTDAAGSVFEADIARLAEAGITKGCNPPLNDHFCPDRNVTRAEMAAFVVRAFDIPQVASVPPGVTVDRVPHASMPVGSVVTVCQEDEVLDGIRVRHAAHGSASTIAAVGYVPTVLAFEGGDYDPLTDVWVTPAEAGCSSFEAGWDPRANIISPPLTDLRITSHFGNRLHPIAGVWRLHGGTDFGAPTGTPVFAAASGEVTATASTHPAYGRMVDVRHPGGLLTRYAHLSSIDVSVGQFVEPGEILGKVGCTGSCTGPHLHFETREFGVAVDPLTYLR